MALFFQPGQQREGVLAQKVHIGQAVAFGVALGHGNGIGADVGSGDPGGPALGSVQRKAAGMGEAVQHRVACCQPCHGPAVVLLVQEKAGFLAVLKVHMVEHAVLADLGLGAGGVGLAGQVEPALVLLQPFLGAQGLVVALVDAGNGLAVGPQHLGQQGEQHRLELFHAHAEGLGDQDIVEAVHGQAGKLVGLAKDHPAGGQVGGLQHGLAVGPGVLHPAAPESGVKGVVGVAADEPHPDLAVQRHEAGAQVRPLGADHIGQGAVFGFGVRGVEDVVLVHPGVAAHQQALGVFVDGVYRISAFFHGDLLGCSFQIHPFIIP